MRERKTVIVLLLIFSFFLFTIYIPLGTAVENYWSTMSSMPTERFSFGVAVVNGKI